MTRQEKLECVVKELRNRCGFGVEIAMSDMTRGRAELTIFRENNGEYILFGIMILTYLNTNKRWVQQLDGTCVLAQLSNLFSNCQT